VASDGAYRADIYGRNNITNKIRDNGLAKPVNDYRCKPRDRDAELSLPDGVFTQIRRKKKAERVLMALLSPKHGRRDAIADLSWGNRKAGSVV